MNTEELVSKTVNMLQEAKESFKNPVILWSTGKDSTLSLSLCREAFGGRVPFPVLHIDTGLQFGQMSEFRDKVAKDWNLDLIVEKSDKAGKVSPSQETSNQVCCQTLKIDAVRNAIEQHGFDAVILSICRDKQPIMNKERMWERKKKTGKASDRLQVDPVFNLQTDFGADSSCTRINPILHWDEIAIWEYAQKMEIPVNPMYFAKDGVRYRSLGCQPCTNPIKSSAKNIAEIIEELKVAKGPEEPRRTQEEKDKEEIMQKLKDMGYM
jgi:sulfate adenylyltransferase subunit 2